LPSFAFICLHLPSFAFICLHLPSIVLFVAIRVRCLSLLFVALSPPPFRFIFDFDFRSTSQASDKIKNTNRQYFSRDQEPIGLVSPKSFWILEETNY
jgi:hypothetical protein